jgi:predicted enzyme related to lactoylglutathione lyase
MTGLKAMLGCLILGTAAVGLRADAPPATVPAINSPATSDYYPGKFVWANLYTADVAGAAQFYSQLFGWTAQSESGHSPRSILFLSGRPIAGIVTRSTDWGERVHARWVPFASVPDVRKAAAAAQEAGARVLHEPHAVPDRGMQALLADREEAVFGLIHSSSGDPGEYRAEPGEWTWAQLFVRNIASAAEFYGRVVGYDVIADQRTADSQRLILASGGFSRASILPLPSTGPHARPAWLLFVRVPSVSDTAARVAGLGGRVLAEPAISASRFKQAIIADPAGGALGLVELPAEEDAR